MTARLISLDAVGEWRDALAGWSVPATLRPEYLAALRSSVKLPTFLYVDRQPGGALFCPLSVRRFEAGGVSVADAYTPYGSHAVTTGGVDRDAARVAWLGCLRDAGLVAAYVACDPAAAPAPLGTPDEHVASSQRPIFLLDLRRPLDDIHASLDKGHRYELRRFQESDWALEYDTAILTDAFPALYRETVERVGASGVYRFTDETLRALCALPTALLVGARQAGRLEAVALFLYSPHGADYFLNASSDSGREAARALLWEGVARLRAAGAPYLNLGGGARPGDGLEAFKRRFGGEPRPLAAYKQILDAERFGAACRAADKEPGTAGFFPPYWEGR